MKLKTRKRLSMKQKTKKGGCGCGKNSSIMGIGNILKGGTGSFSNPSYQNLNEQYSIPLNDSIGLGGDPQNGIVDSRLGIQQQITPNLMGGKRRKTTNSRKRKGNKQKQTTGGIKRKSKKMRGGEPTASGFFNYVIGSQVPGTLNTTNQPLMNVNTNKMFPPLA